MDISRDLCSLFLDRFVNRTDVYNRQWCQGEDFGYAATYEPVTLDLITQHLLGAVTLSLPALSSESTCKWVAWDSDAADGAIDALADVLQSHGWHAIREAKREARDGHLWVLFDKPVPSVHAIRFGACFERAAGIAKGSIEFFPKQPRAAKVGSALRAPLGIHRKPSAGNCRGWFEGPALNVVAQLEWLAAQPLNSAAALVAYAEELERRERATNPPKRIPPPVSGGTRRNILELVPEHQRRRLGSEIVAQCPACAESGGDTHADNLRIKVDGSTFCCVEGGPGRVHKQRDILRALGAWN